MAVAVLLAAPKPVHRYIHRAPVTLSDRDLERIKTTAHRPRPHRRRRSTPLPPSRLRPVARRHPASRRLRRYRRDRVVAGGRSRPEHQPQRRCPHRPVGAGKRARRATGGTAMTEDSAITHGTTANRGCHHPIRNIRNFTAGGTAGRIQAAPMRRIERSTDSAASGQHRRAASGPHSHGRRIHRPPRAAGMADRRHRAAQQALRLHLAHRSRQDRGVAVQCLHDQRRPHDRPTGCVPGQCADPRRRESSRSGGADDRHGEGLQPAARIGCPTCCRGASR